jgi:hypothetical protein
MMNGTANGRYGTRAGRAGITHAESDRWTIYANRAMTTAARIAMVAAFCNKICQKLPSTFHNNGYAAESETDEIHPEVFSACGHRRAVVPPTAGFDERLAVDSNFPWG